MAGELLHPEHLKEHLADLLEWKNLTLTRVYGAKGYTMDELMSWVETYCGAIKPYITDTGRFLKNAQKEGKSILFEAQLGALRDLDYGIYPYTTSSNAVAAYAPVGSGLPTAKLDEVVGVVKAYSSCVGEGRSSASGLAKRRRSCATQARSTAQRRADPAVSVPSTWSPRATVWKRRARQTSPSRSSMC